MTLIVDGRPVISRPVADIRAAAREAAVLYQEDTPGAVHERAVAAAETRHAIRLRLTAEYMGRPPGVGDGVSSASVVALRALPEDWPEMQAEQNRQKDTADAAGDRGLYLAAATALAVVAEVLAAAFLESGRLSRMAWPTALAALSLGITTWTMLG
ncbi:hypothetical protein ABZ250_10935 [Streptomyces afghaniensis]|uniref:hypothetical protein n=1 Tax=Streptomyces afghaniensis TaxID=66865 RepID=UPI0033B80941